jgi:hypothetical protein
MRELQAARHISGHEEPVGDPHLIVGRDPSAIVDRCASVLGAQGAEVRGTSPDGDEQLGALDRRTVRELDDTAGAAGPDPLGGDPQAELETLFDELVGDVLRGEGVIAREDPVAALHERDADPEPDEDLRHLHPDDSPAKQATALFNLDIMFFSCVGISMEGGLTDTNEDEADLKNTMMQHSRKKVAMVDSSKFGLVAFCKICALSGIDVLITDRDPGPEWRDALIKAQVELLFP